MTLYRQSSIIRLSKRLPCRPPYFNLGENLLPCTSQEELKQCHSIILSQQGLGNNMEHPPCRSLEKVDFDYFELDVPDRHPPSITISVVFVDETYREIARVKAFDMNALVGNIGGYVGIFVGYSLIMHFPDAIMKILRTVRKRKDHLVTAKETIVKRNSI